MFEDSETSLVEEGRQARLETIAPLTAALDLVGSLDGDELSDVERVDQIALLEQLKNAAAAAQARISLVFEASQRARAAAKGIPARRQGDGIADQIALARLESPHAGRRHLSLAHALTELPHTAAVLARGETSEWRATLVARETATLSREHRAAVDTDLAPRLVGLGDREVAAQAREAGYKLDPHQLVDRLARAEADRCVTIRPAPDAMTYVTGLLPMTQGVALYAALKQHATVARAAGDVRSQGQLMADALITRVTGLAETTEGVAQPPVEVHLVMTDRTLLGHDDTPAHLVGHGLDPTPLPAWLARRTVRDADQAWLRRLFAHPDSAELVATDTRRRLFSRARRDFLIARDRHCRRPWCGAPIRHADHIERHAEGGQTSLTNGEGLCESCDYTKQASGWKTVGESFGGTHRVITTTPTGHTYVSEPPRPPTGPDHYAGTRAAAKQMISQVEIYLDRLILEHAYPDRYGAGP